MEALKIQIQKVNALVDSNENSAVWQKIMKKLMSTKGVNFGNINDSDYFSAWMEALKIQIQK